MVSLNKANVINIIHTRKKNGINFHFSYVYMTRVKVFDEWTKAFLTKGRMDERTKKKD